MGNFTQAFDRRTYFTSYYFMLNIFARAFTGFTSETVTCCMSYPQNEINTLNTLQPDTYGIEMKMP